ncbi:MAG TPA: lysine--tRNA ligase [Actinomycetota bacterium]|nr:lysine--tRNA ligase [Actinomycetota bacterium]
MTGENPAAPPADDVLTVRREKLDRLRGRGVDPFALRFDRDALATELHERFGDLEAGASSNDTVRVAGRLVGLRRLGKLTFGVLRDSSGDIQLFLSDDTLTDEAQALLEDLDLGDWIGAQGDVVRTKRGELSVAAAELTLLSKALRPLPEKWHGLRDVELRFRQRYLDLATNREARERVMARARMLAALREHLEARGFVEVDTPILQAMPGGGLARPFVTHHEALDVPLYLRIAPELYLKRLLIGGLERVYEIGRNFRNEGIDREHEPEFTSLEAYQAYGTYEDMMELAEGLVKAGAEATLGSLTVEFRGTTLDLSKPWRRVPLAELVSEAVGERVGLDTPAERLCDIAEAHEVRYDPEWSAGQLLAELYEKLVEETIVEPTFVKDFPKDVSPLARPHRDDPRYTEHFDLVIAGIEMGPSYSELTDPDEQRERFEMQAALKSAGDEEAHPYDDDFVLALEHGMPPAGGLGLGVDRLLMFLTDAPSLREVILFPTLRPERRGG